MVPAEPLRIGIVGPSRRREGTGPHVARFLQAAGAQVVAVAASGPESAAAAAGVLGRKCGHPVTPYRTPAAMLSGAGLDGVAICSPAECHEEHLAGALRAGVGAFCEKPLLWSGRPGDAGRAAALVAGFARRGLVLHHNTQWRYVLDDIATVLGLDRVQATGSFGMRMSPPVPGPAMYRESASHPVGLLVALGATGFGPVAARWYAGGAGLEVSTVATRPGREALAVRLVFEAKADQPRPASITLDGLRIERLVSSLDPYRLALRVGGRVFDLVDPLDRSVLSFLGRLAGTATPAPDLATEMRLFEELGLAVAAAAPMP